MVNDRAPGALAPVPVNSVTPLDEHIAHALRGSAALRDEAALLRRRNDELEIALSDARHRVEDLKYLLDHAELERDKYLAYATTMLTHLKTIRMVGDEAERHATEEMRTLQKRRDTERPPTEAEAEASAGREQIFGAGPQERPFGAPDADHRKHGHPEGVPTEIPQFLQKGPAVGGGGLRPPTTEEGSPR
jgi:hypothetical protein